VTPADDGQRRWLLLIHQLPPTPDYLRVKVRRRLRTIGAVPLKQSVYVLPETEAAREDFEWLAAEIAAASGEATICAAALLTGTSDAELEARFRAEADANYRRLVQFVAAVDPASSSAPDALRRLRARFETMSATDFFGGARRADAERSLGQLESRLSRAPDTAGPGVSATRPRGAVWVTRAGVFIDRIASAWLIRHFIDPEARFRFVPAKGYRPGEGEIRFDMYQGEFTHVGDRCTFEMLLVHFGIDDPALEAIAEVVHDVDIKDGKFGRAETAGIAAVIEGITHDTADDAERIERGSTVFAGWYRQMADRGRA
jgi:hypothetical protein